METGEHMKNCQCEICLEWRKKRRLELAAPDLFEALDYVRRMTGFGNLSDSGAALCQEALSKAMLEGVKP